MLPLPRRRVLFLEGSREMPSRLGFHSECSLPFPSVHIPADQVVKHAGTLSFTEADKMAIDIARRPTRKQREY